MAKVISKHCPSCNETKPRAGFTVRMGSPDGLRVYCRVCANEKNRLWYAANRESRLITIKRHYEANRDSKAAVGKLWLVANLESYRAYLKNYREENADRLAAAAGFYRARRGSPGCIPAGTNTKKLIDDTIWLYVKARRLTEETGVPHHVDHIIELADGGLHHPDNLQVITATENWDKSRRAHNDRQPIDY